MVGSNLPGRALGKPTYSIIDPTMSQNQPSGGLKLTRQSLGEAHVDECEDKERHGTDDESNPPGPHPQRAVRVDRQAGRRETPTFNVKGKALLD